MIILHEDECPFHSELHLTGREVSGINYNEKDNASMYMGALPQMCQVVKHG